MVQFGSIDAVLSGDVGGLGLSRMHFQRADAGTILVADCNAAASAWHGVWQGVHSYLPLNYSVTFAADVAIREVDTGAPDVALTLSSVPANVTGSDNNKYAAGVGVRVNWNSASVRNRRFMRSATFIVPLCSDAFTTAGVVDSTFQSSLITLLQTCLTSLNGAGLEMIVWHRPAKGTFVGGAAGLVVGATVPGVAASLRSRRS